MKKLKYILIIFFGFCIVSLVSAHVILNTYKDEITEAINEEISGKINGTFESEDLRINFIKNFPSLSISLINLKIRDSLYSHHHTDFLQAGEILLEVSLLDILKKKVSIKSVKVENARIFIFKGKDKYSNIKLFKTKHLKTKKNQDPFIDIFGKFIL